MTEAISKCLSAAHKQLYHLITQHGSACLLGDKPGAIKLLVDIKNTFKLLEMLVKDVEGLEDLAIETDDILAIVESIESP